MKELSLVMMVVTVGILTAAAASATEIRYTSTADLEQQISFDDGKDHSDIEQELERRRIRDEQIHNNYHHSIGDDWIEAWEHG